MSSSAENVSIAIQDVAKGTSSQAEGLVDVTEILTEFEEKIENISLDISDVEMILCGY